MNLRILCLDDNLQTLNSSFEQLFSSRLHSGTIPELMGGVARPFTIRGFVNGLWDIELVSNSHNDPNQVVAEIETTFSRTLFDIVLVDDNWGVFGAAVGQRRLLLEALNKIRGTCPELPVFVLFTAHWSQPDRVQKFCEVIDRYPDASTRITGLAKTDTSGLMLLFQRVVIEKQMAEERLVAQTEAVDCAKRLKTLAVGPLHDEDGFMELVGKSVSMRQVYSSIRRVAPTDANVLIRGETGTGKELVARAIHANSGRKDMPFVCVNCASLSPALFESEIFGHVKGAFTGATEARKGRVEMAEKGTLFLDEIGEIDGSLQVKLLRLVQQKEFVRVGSEMTQKADVRIIAATNADLETDMKNRKFRDDLYYRLNVFSIEVPALGDHGEDIPLLVRHFIRECASTFHKVVSIADDEAMRALTTHYWQGNIRELRNCIQRVVILCEGSQITLSDVLAGIGGQVKSEVNHPDGSLVEKFSAVLRTKARYYLDMHEEACQKLPEAEITQHQIASFLGVSRPAVSEKYSTYGAVMLAFLDRHPQAWPALRQKTKIHAWCRSSQSL